MLSRICTGRKDIGYVLDRVQDIHLDIEDAAIDSIPSGSPQYPARDMSVIHRKRWRLSTIQLIVALSSRGGFSSGIILKL